MNDLRFDLLSNLNQSLKLVLIHGRNHKNSFFDISTTNRYYMAYKLITLLFILFILIRIKFIPCHSYMMFIMNSMSIYND